MCAAAVHRLDRCFQAHPSDVGACCPWVEQSNMFCYGLNDFKTSVEVSSEFGARLAAANCSNNNGGGGGGNDQCYNAVSQTLMCNAMNGAECCDSYLNIIGQCGGGDVFDATQFIMGNVAQQFGGVGSLIKVMHVQQMCPRA